jgi:hypothetical protein
VLNYSYVISRSSRGLPWLITCPPLQPVGLNNRIRRLNCGFLVVSAGDPVLVDEAAEDGSAVDSVVGEVEWG